MTLKLIIPEDFEPFRIKPKKAPGETPSSRWWVYPEGDVPKTYEDANAEEVLNWAKSLYPDLPIEDSSVLRLMVSKSTVIDVCISYAIGKHRDIFGGPEFWDSLENWQRPSHVLRNKDKKNK